MGRVKDSRFPAFPVSGLFGKPVPNSRFSRSPFREREKREKPGRPASPSQEQKL